MPNQIEEKIDDRSIEFGRDIARRVFEKRGNHSEAHLKEVELAALLAIAYADGAKIEIGRIVSIGLPAGRH